MPSLIDEVLVKLREEIAYFVTWRNKKNFVQKRIISDNL